MNDERAGAELEMSPSPEDLAAAEWLDPFIERPWQFELASIPAAQGSQQACDVRRVVRMLQQNHAFLSELSSSVTDEDASSLTSPAENSPPWDPFPDDFRIERLLGSGTFGEVWLAFDLHLHCHRALKVLRLPERHPNWTESRATFEADARMLARLRHPNIISIHAWRFSDLRPVLVIDYVDGGSLDDLLQSAGALAWDVAARYIADIAEALLHVHHRGVLHRDIKPANILLDAEADEAILTDFGLAQLAGIPGAVAGTPAYWAPEAFTGEFSPATDVYALGATLFRLLTAEPPFTASTLRELQARSAHGMAADDSRLQSVPLFLETLLRRALDPNPQTRIELAEFARVLRTGLNHTLTTHVAAAVESDPPAQSAVNLMLRIWKRQASTRSAVTPRTPQLPTTRNLRRVTKEPPVVDLRTGDHIQIEVTADRDGYLTVFNVGSQGDLNLLYPDPEFGDRRGGCPDLQAHQPLRILDDVELTPPPGLERLWAIWSLTALDLSLKELAGIAGAAPPGATVSTMVSPAYAATRSMKRVQSQLKHLAPGTWKTAVLELEHH